MTYYEFFMGTITFGGFQLWRLIREVEKHSEKGQIINKKLI
jgi:hypothetical protein